MLTPKQTDPVSSALLIIAARDNKPILHCPCCGMLSISQKAREKVFPFMDMPCPKCRVYLRMKWGRSLFIGFIAALILLTVAGLVGIPGFHKLPATLVIILDVCLVAAFHAIKRRLPLETRR
jgi:hypothetical protein